MSNDPLPPRHFRHDLATVAVFLAVIFASSIPYAIWGQGGLS